MITRESKETQKPVCFDRGKIYFTRTQERRFYCGATVVMAILGLLYYVGIL